MDKRHGKNPPGPECGFPDHLVRLLFPEHVAAVVEHLARTLSPEEWETLKVELKRGDKSLYDAQPRKDGQCHWRRHMRGCIAERYGYHLNQAKRDSQDEMFHWVGMDKTIKATKRRKKWRELTTRGARRRARYRKPPHTEERYSRAQNFRADQILQEAGLIARTRKVRDGQKFLGWTVREHDDWARLVELPNGQKICMLACARGDSSRELDETFPVNQMRLKRELDETPSVSQMRLPNAANSAESKGCGDEQKTKNASAFGQPCNDGRERDSLAKSAPSLARHNKS